MNDKEKYLFLSELIKEQQRKVDEETAILTGFRRKLLEYSGNYDENTKTDSLEEAKTLPTEFNEDLTITEKVYVALYKIQSGTTKDVVKSLMNLSPTYKEDKAFKDVRNYLSRLNIAKKIKSKGAKGNKGYIYSIK
jgi:hypothetical protein